MGTQSTWGPLLVPNQYITPTMSADDMVNENELLFCDGLFCCMSGPYFDMPSCIGCSGKSQLCCIVTKSCLKLGTEPLCCTAPEGDTCQCGIGCWSCGLTSCTQGSCCASQGQFFCCYESIAFPPSAEFPALCGYCGISCYPKIGCCNKVGDLTGQSSADPAAQPLKQGN